MRRMPSVVAAVAMFALWACAVSPFPAQPRIAHAAVTNSYSAFVNGAQLNPHSAGSNCSADLSGAYSISPGLVVKKIIRRSASEMYIGGCFLNWAGIAAADYIAKWDGTQWSAVGSDGAGNGALNGQVLDMEIFKGDLVVAGKFTDAGGIAQADMIAKWDGSTWSALPAPGNTSPQHPTSTTDYVTALAVNPQANAGSTSDDTLVAVGNISSGIHDGFSSYISNTVGGATWNGTSWSALAAGSPIDATERLTYCLPRDVIVVGGVMYMASYRNAGWTTSFNMPGCVLKKLSGGTWSRLATSFTNPYSGQGFGVLALAEFGGKVVAGGNFSSSYGSYLTQYDGSTFSTVNNISLVGVQYGVVHTLTTGLGSLFVGGVFAGTGTAQSAVIKWDGTSANWTGLANLNTSMIDAMFVDENFSGSDDRLVIGAESSDIGANSDADWLAAISMNNNSTLDSMSSTQASPALSFSNLTTSYSINIPNASASETISYSVSQTGASYSESSDGTTYLVGDGSLTVNVAEGSTAVGYVKVISTDGSSETVYSVSVTRAAAPITTSSALPASSSTSSVVSQSTDAPAHTATSVATTAVPTTVAAPATTVAPQATTVLASGPTARPGKTVSGTTLFKSTGATVPAGARVAVSVAPSSAKYCKVSGTSVKALKAGSCKVTVTVTPKKGKAVKKTVALKVG